MDINAVLKNNLLFIHREQVSSYMQMYFALHVSGRRRSNGNNNCTKYTILQCVGGRRSAYSERSPIFHRCACCIETKNSICYNLILINTMIEDMDKQTVCLRKHKTTWLCGGASVQ